MKMLSRNSCTLYEELAHSQMQLLLEESLKRRTEKVNSQLKSIRRYNGGKRYSSVTED